MLRVRRFRVFFPLELEPACYRIVRVSELGTFGIPFLF